MDIEKVKKGLEIHADRSDKTDCDDCPYNKDCFKKGDCIGQLCSDALALLKDKKAVKPLAIKQEMFDEYYGAVACCPKCDCMWIMYMDNDMHYCPECGQAVKWGDANEND